MKNATGTGNTLTLAAPYAVTSGQGALIGAIFGVAITDAAQDEEIAFQLCGTVNMNKVGSQAWTVGARVYWDNTNRRCTTAASGNTLIGVATEAVAVGAADTIGEVRLNASF